ncbi:molybdopterin-guanine dinucleotide biosynthesis protein B [Staphylococcus condimenti]|uniref:Molybdopterin-guanine dinucleotide biosynthesis protein B n=1 Tax=Staphylococcus condimenti TaxID=70255 RepID=A0A4Q7CQ84_9STAP|nr:molybdopterin-guanine dinucleotide biosynthesis protein B [Staphylococcus condimenti]RZI03779.1 molybdopterin-guanine dinucleotide biosynthesis protein B [Staphylococcus condimenti]RZI03829.1 molybdopterin-guanine dinucleotide biosynthesis protein B [Staphylococcus condimenti]
MILQIVGYKDSGKTTLLAETVKFLKNKGYCVVTIKHHGHGGEDITLQDNTVDHMKHFEAGADQSIVQGHELRETITRTSEASLSQIIDSAVTIEYDIILAEGFKNADYDKVVIYKNPEELSSLTALSHVQYKLPFQKLSDLEPFKNWLESWIDIKKDESE